MITLSNENKKIELSYGDEIVAETNEYNVRTYKVNLPVVVCSNIVDAKCIQQQTTEFINRLTHDLIK